MKKILAYLCLMVAAISAVFIGDGDMMVLVPALFSYFAGVLLVFAHKEEKS